MIFIDTNNIDVKHRSTNVLSGDIKNGINTGTSYLQNKELACSFNGLNTTLNYVKTNMPVAMQGKQSANKGSSFHFFKDYETCMDTYSNKPQEVRDFTENDVKLTGGDANGIQVNYDMTGDFIDIDRYLTGEPEHYGSMYDGIPRGKRVTIVFTCDWASNTSTETINNRSKRIVRLVDWLESQGVRCKVIALFSQQCVHTEITIKEFSEPLNLNDIAVVSHSDFLRRIEFRINEYSKTHVSNYGTSYYADSLLKKYNSINTLPLELQEGHTLFIGTSGNANSNFDTLEQQLTETLSDSNSDYKLFKVML